MYLNYKVKVYLFIFLFPIKLSEVLISNIAITRFFFEGCIGCVNIWCSIVLIVYICALSGLTLFLDPSYCALVLFPISLFG